MRPGGRSRRAPTPPSRIASRRRRATNFFFAKNPLPNGRAHVTVFRHLGNGRADRGESRERPQWFYNVGFNGDFQIQRG